MGLPYHALNEVKDRYINTIIWYGDAPVYVHGMGFNDLWVSFVGEPKNKNCYIPVDNETLSDGPFRLGYVNKLMQVTCDDEGDAETVYTTSYVTRVPARQWKQGLCASNLKFSPALANFTTLCGNPMFRDMLQGKYPTFTQAKKLLKGNIQSVAFARQLCLSKDACEQYHIGYRGKNVAVSDDGVSFKLLKNYLYLREFLNESKINYETETGLFRATRQ